VDAAPLTCAGVTTYKAVKVSGLRPTERAAIFGIGGLGHLALQYARIFGGDAIGVDVTAEKLQLAKDLGAVAVVNARETDPVVALQAMGGVDVAVVLAADPAVLQQAHASLRRGGRLVLVSLPRDNVMRLPIFETVLKGISVIGSIVGTRQDLAEVFALHVAGRTRVVVEQRPLSAVNDAIDDVLAGRVDARVVLRP
jgi:alcohol dehydrogenase, propanol-preferring